MNVLSIVLNNFTHDSRVLKECQSLQKAGYDVSVLALHDDSEGLQEREDVFGVPVWRIRLISKAWSKNIVVQMLKYVEFVIRAQLVCHKVNIIHCNDLNALPLGVIGKICSFGKIKIVYDAHEFETEREGVTEFGRLLLKILERSLIGFVDKVITVSDGIANEYLKLYGSEKPEVVLNSPPIETISKKNIFRDKFSISNDKKIFLYQGVLSDGNGINVIIESFKRLNESNAVLVLMGYGPIERYVKETAAIYDNIFFHEAVPMVELLQYTSSADFGIACIDGSGSLSYYYTLPNKLFEYSMCGIPTIISSLPEMVKHNEKYNFGVVCDYSEESFIRAVQIIMDKDYRTLQNGALKMAKECCWEVQEQKLLKLYNSFEV